MAKYCVAVKYSGVMEFDVYAGDKHKAERLAIDYFREEFSSASECDEIEVQAYEEDE